MFNHPEHIFICIINIVFVLCVFLYVCVSFSLSLSLSIILEFVSAQLMVGIIILYDNFD